jgi:acetyl esterase/lipase
MTKRRFLHFHGDGWVLMGEGCQDDLLYFMAHKAGLAVIMVGYQLPPEHPFPAGVQDCEDEALNLVKIAGKEYGSALHFRGGEVCSPVATHYIAELELICA